MDILSVDKYMESMLKKDKHMRVHVTCPHCPAEQDVICALIEDQQTFWCKSCHRKCLITVHLTFIITSGEPDAGHLGIKEEVEPTTSRLSLDPIRVGPHESDVYTTLIKKESE